MQPSFPKEVTTELPLFVSIQLEYIIAAVPLAMAIPTLALSLLASLLATRRLARSSGAFSLILLRTRLPLHAASAIAAMPSLVLAFVPYCMYSFIQIQIQTIEFIARKFKGLFIVAATARNRSKTHIFNAECSYCSRPGP